MTIPFRYVPAARRVRNELIRCLPHLLKAHMECSFSGRNFQLYAEAIEKLLEITRLTTDLIAEDTQTK